MTQRRASNLTIVLALLGMVAPSLRASPVVLQVTQGTGNGAAVTAASPGPSDVAGLGAVLLDPASPAGRRELAAARLLAEGSDQALGFITQGLRPTSAVPTQLSSAGAISAASRPDPRLIEPLLLLLASDVSLPVKREAGRALGSFREDPQVRSRLAELAVGSGTTSTRQGAVAGLARLPGRSSAQALMLLLDGDAAEELERDAADALRTITGVDLATDDLEGWQRWWEQMARLDEPAFSAELLRSRATEAQGLSQRADRAVAALLDVWRRRYRQPNLPPGDQLAILQELLHSPVPELREVGAALVLEDANFAQDIAPPVMEAVRSSIADPDPRVRALAAQVVQRRTDADSLDLLMRQISRENAQSARLAQIRALASLRDPRALPVLLDQLRSPSPAVRIAAARASADLANASGPQAIQQAAIAIRQSFEVADPGTRHGRRLRRDLLTALADLREPTLATFYLNLLTRPPSPSAPVRAQALRGMGTLGDDALSDTIVQFLRDEDPKVREEAVRALGRTSRGFVHAEVLRSQLSDRVEPSQAVRDAAWQSLVGMFQRAPARQLASWPDRFRDQPERRLVILRALAEKAEQAGDLEQLAYRRQEMADVLLEDLRRPAEAAELYQQALQYSLEARRTAGTIQTLSESTLRARYRAQQWNEAASFAAEVVSRNPGFVENIGSLVKREAQVFADAGQPEVARQLIDAALQMQPPLDERTRRQLQDQRRMLPGA